MRLAILADIHGNLPALEAVVTDLQTQRPDAVYLAGDQVNRCPWNNEVLDLLATQGWSGVYGNHDLVVGRINTPENRPPFTNAPRFPDLWWTQAQLHPHHLATLRQLPAELRLDFGLAPVIRLLHGIPGNPFIGFLADDEIANVHQALDGVVESVVITAHTHRPLARTVGRWQIFNGGSVGAPYNSDPRAQYLLLDARQGRWQPTFRLVEYDRSLLSPAFTTSGMLREVGAIAELALRTVLTGEPWISDFGHWLRFQPATLIADLTQALTLYLTQHGPGRWAFDRIV